jgi:hypothetical protein
MRGGWEADTDCGDLRDGRGAFWLSKLAPFRVMHRLSSRMLLGRRWLFENVGLVLDLGLGCAEFKADG